MKIEYFNANGASIVLNAGNYLVSNNDLRDFVWEYTATNRPTGYGGRVKFNRPVQEKILNIGIRGKTKEEFNDNAKALLALTEADILRNTPGKLYLGEQYLECYLSVKSTVNYYSYRNGWVSKDLTLVVTEPFWNTEKTQRYLSGLALAVDGGKRYGLKYPYRYMPSASSGNVDNEHYSDSPMIITIYGEAVNPSITIGGNIYAIDFSVAATQRIIINQLKREIYLLTLTGARTNLFNYRDKENDIFKPIAPGNQTVIYDGSFDFDISVINQRSEPTWV